MTNPFLNFKVDRPELIRVEIAISNLAQASVLISGMGGVMR